MRRNTERTRKLLTRFHQNIADISIFLQNNIKAPKNTPPLFVTSRRKELNSLLEKGVFEVVNITDIPQGTRIFNLRFVDEVKNAGTDKAFEKSRLVVQVYNDSEKELVFTQSPTIQRVSQRLILALAAILQTKSTT